MENKNETEVSTQQYYGNVETNQEEQVVETPVVEAEQSYSLEDLHPEEEVKETAPVAAPEEEIQPDPTVIEGVKETIGDQSALAEQTMPTPAPQVQPAPQPVVSTIPKPAPIPTAAGTSVQQPMQPQNKNDVPNAKVFYLIFGIILLFVIVGLPLYSSINSSLNNQKGESEPINNNQSEQENKPIEEQPTPQQPNTNTNEIVFDMSLAFDKGLVSNEKEINQKEGFLPTELTGVIRCDLEKPIVSTDFTKLASTYLYYDNYKLESAITVTKLQYVNPALYLERKDAFLIYKTAGDQYESLDVNIIQDDSNSTVTSIMKFNLRYENSTPVEGLEPNNVLIFSSVYGTNIKVAMEKILNPTDPNSNVVCSAISTSDAGV